MKKILALTLSLSMGIATASAQELTLQLNQQGVTVSPTLYGIMTEEINHSYDGGLLAQLVNDATFKAFRNPQRNPWSPKSTDLRFWHITDSARVTHMDVDDDMPLNDALRSSLRIDVKAAQGSISNDGYWGYPVRPTTIYNGAVWLRGQQGGGTVTIRLESLDGKTVYATATTDAITQGWKKHTFTLTTAADVKATKDARLVYEFSNQGTYWMGRPQLMPPTYSPAPAPIFRQDIMQLLVDMKPKFLRLPGGNFVEGNKFADRYDWKRTLGDPDQRPGHQGCWGYWVSDGMGLLEYLEWCETMGAEPILAVFAGYSLNGDHLEGPLVEPFIQEALEEIEYVIGDVNTKWGARRAQDGHPKPFPLHYVEIGNEDFFDQSGSYRQRFQQFRDAIKAKYPQLEVIATNAADCKDLKGLQVDIQDDHYYSNSASMFHMAHQYDKTKRGGTKIFVGEWATREGEPTTNMQAALGDAAFLTGLERNSDVVMGACYAPLFVHVEKVARQWESDLIGYDALTAYGSPSYWVQKLFALNLGTSVVNIAAKDMPSYTLPLSEKDAKAGKKADTVEQLYYVATRDAKHIYLKVVNVAPKAQTVTINLDGAKVKGKATMYTVSNNDNQATNTISEPNNIVPVTSKVKVGKTFRLTLKPYSVNVITMEI